MRISDSIRHPRQISDPVSERIPDVYPTFPERLPDEPLTSGGYSLQFANSEADLDAIYRLRYEVFNLELAEGLNESHKTGRDEDEFDPFHHHLYVTEDSTGDCIGTYRMQPSVMASNGIGYYASTEFDFSTFPESILDDSVEIGRACIASGHRTLRVLHLLWRGLGIYLAYNKMRYLFGCCSLTSQDEQEGLAVYRYLRENGHVITDWTLYPLPENDCRSGNADAGDVSPVPVKIPRLMRTYLAQGAKICGPPAIDRSFKTIDYLALFDTKHMSRSALAFYRIKE